MVSEVFPLQTTKLTPEDLLLNCTIFRLFACLGIAQVNLASAEAYRLYSLCYNKSREARPCGFCGHETMPWVNKLSLAMIGHLANRPTLLYKPQAVGNRCLTLGKVKIPTAGNLLRC